MIPAQSVRDLVHGLLDSLQDTGSREDYYRINHATADEINALGREIAPAVTAWLSKRGVAVSHA